MEPYKNLPENIEAAKRSFAFGKDWYAYPIFSKNGDYSDILKERLANVSKAEGRSVSRLPEFTPDEIIELRSRCTKRMPIF